MARRHAAAHLGHVGKEPLPIALQAQDRFALGLERRADRRVAGDEARARYITALDEDLNTAAANAVLFDLVRELNAQDLSRGDAAAVLGWRKRFRARLDLIAARYPPRITVDLDDVADMLSVMADGGIILSRIVKDKDALPRQVMLYRDFVRGIFMGA